MPAAILAMEIVFCWICFRVLVAFFPSLVKPDPRFFTPVTAPLLSTVMVSLMSAMVYLLRAFAAAASSLSFLLRRARK